MPITNKNLDDAIVFGRKLGLTIIEQSDGVTLRVEYPSGEHKDVRRDDPMATVTICDMAANLI